MDRRGSPILFVAKSVEPPRALPYRTCWSEELGASGHRSWSASTRLADQQPCQNGLVEDHSGDYRIETLRPGRALAGFRLGEVRDRVVVWWSW
jgi:hypothetical protein